MKSSHISHTRLLPFIRPRSIARHETRHKNTKATVLYRLGMQLTYLEALGDGEFIEEVLALLVVGSV